jgi:hypothetical protein
MLQVLVEIVRIYFIDEHRLCLEIYSNIKALIVDRTLHFIGNQYLYSFRYRIIG